MNDIPKSDAWLLARLDAQAHMAGYPKNELYREAAARIRHLLTRIPPPVVADTPSITPADV